MNGSNIIRAVLSYFGQLETTGIVSIGRRRELSSLQNLLYKICKIKLQKNLYNFKGLLACINVNLYDVEQRQDYYEKENPSYWPDYYFITAI